MALSNIEIEEFLKQKSDNFKGVYSADNIPQHISKNKYFSIVCNLSNSDEIGSHFITIIGLPLYTIYIDTFGIPCFKSTIYEFLKATNRAIFHNIKRIQHSASQRCGYYCILFVLFYENKKKSNITLRFYNSSLKNDKKCENYINKLSF